jgi:hypothetical protein
MLRIVFPVLDITLEASNNQYLGFEQTLGKSLREGERERERERERES